MQTLVPIKRSEVPAYLHSGELFQSLDDENDDEISVPSNCIKTDTSVSSLSELEDLLCTVRFWIVSPYIAELMDYVVDRRVPGVKDIIAEYRLSFPILFTLVKDVHQTRSKQVCNLAAKHGCFEFLKYFAERKKPLDVRTLKIAAENGHLDCVSYCFDYLLTNGRRTPIDIMEWSKEFFSSNYRKCASRSVFLNTQDWSKVIIAGHVNCLAFLLKHGLRPSAKYNRLAASSGQLACLQCLLSIQPDRSPQLASCAVENDQLDCLKCIVEQPGGYEVSLETWQAAMRCNGDVNIKTAADKQGEDEASDAESSSDGAASETEGTINENACEATSVTSSYRCLLYLVDTVPPNDTSVLTRLACEYNNLAVLRLLHQRGFQFNIELVKIAAQKGSLLLLQFLHDTLHFDCWVPSTMAAAAGAGQLQLVKQLHELGCAWDESAPIAALRANEADCLKYLIEQRGVPENAAFTSLDVPLRCWIVLNVYQHIKLFREDMAELAAAVRSTEARIVALEVGRGGLQIASGQALWGNDWMPSTTTTAVGGKQSLIEQLKSLSVSSAAPLGATEPTTHPEYLTSEEFAVPDESSLDSALLSVHYAAYEEYLHDSHGCSTGFTINNTTTSQLEG